MTNSTLPPNVLNVMAPPVTIGRHVPVGSSSILLPGITIGEGSAITVLSLVDGSLPEWKIRAAIPRDR